MARRIRPRPHRLLRREVLRELILLDAFYCGRRGETCRVGDYLSRFPELDADWLEAALAAVPGPAGVETMGASPTEVVPDRVRPSATLVGRATSAGDLWQAELK